MNNLTGLIIAFVYIFSLIGIAEGLRRWQGLTSAFTRKVVHIGVGMMIWFVPFLFTSPWPFVLASAFFAVLNFLDWKYGFFAAMSSSDRANLGTVYFPIAAATVTLIFWDQPLLMVAALMPLTWGDGLAPVIGKAYGRHPYTIGSTTRTLEGSTGFFLAAFIATWLALWLMPPPPELTLVAALLPALVVSLATTLTEAVSPWGLDNLTITAVAVVLLLLLF